MATPSALRLVLDRAILNKCLTKAATGFFAPDVGSPGSRQGGTKSLDGRSGGTVISLVALSWFVSWGMFPLVRAKGKIME